MTPVALDGTKLLVLMAAGGIFALAGLWLMFRPPAEGHAATIKLFGLEFQSSSAGLLVFLIGSVFLAVPVFVSENSPAVAPVARTELSGQTRKPSQAGGGSPATGGLVLAGTAEVEPNDHPRGANQIDVGMIYSGKVAANDVDFFEAPLKSDVYKVRYIWRVLTSAGQGYEPGRCELVLMDQFGERLEGKNAPSPGEARTGTVTLSGNERVRVSVRSTGMENSCDYELELRYE